MAIPGLLLPFLQVPDLGFVTNALSAEGGNPETCHQHEKRAD